MNYLAKITLAATLAAVLSSCASTGGTFLNLFPVPKSMDGDVSKTTYTAPGNAFVVDLPYGRESYEWKYAEVRELEDQGVIGIIFGPAALDQDLYHVVLVPLTLGEAPIERVDQLFQHKLGQRKGTYAELARFEFVTNGHQTYYGAYESEETFLILSVTGLGETFYVVEIDSPKLHEDYVATLREALTMRQYEPFNRMLESFRVP